MIGFASAVLTGYFGESNATTKERFEMVVDRLESNVTGKKVVLVGGHVDADAVEHSFAGDKTGCGAADKLISNIAFLGSEVISFRDANGNVTHIETEEESGDRLQAVRGLTEAVVSASGYYTYQDLDAVINDVVDTATDVLNQAKLQGWNGAVMKNVLANRGEERLVVLDTSGGGVHGHTERKVLFNLIDGATFDQDAYFDDTQASEGEGREVFDVDMWHIRDIADALADSPDETQASRLFVAGVAFQVATYLGLCDGSHRPFFAEKI